MRKLLLLTFLIAGVFTTAYSQNDMGITSKSANAGNAVFFELGGQSMELEEE